MGIVNDTYPMCQIKDKLEAMAGSRVFNTLDITKGSHQLLLYEYSKPLNAFATPEGLYQWKVIPLVIQTAGAVFQRLMYQVMKGPQPVFVALYIDDITLYSPSLEQHAMNLDRVFQMLKNAP